MTVDSRYPVGLVLGKFMPLHKGHEYLIRFAQQYCDELVVVVDCLEGQTLSTALRQSWIQQAFPSVRVEALPAPMPQQPAETPDFWPQWRAALVNAVGRPPDVLIASMDYGWPLSDTLGCALVPVDLERESLPVSATLIRQDPMRYWDYLAESARPHYLKRVALMGPESTGKSTCAAALARQLGTVHVPEYAKALIARQGGQFHEHNVMEVAWAQHRTEQALAPAANRLLVCDTNALTTLIWSDTLFGGHPPELEELAQQAHYDLTLLMVPSVPWVDDVHRRVLPASAAAAGRQAFFDTCVHWLEKWGWRYAVVEGDFTEREACVLQHCQQLLTEPGRVPPGSRPLAAVTR